MPTKVKVYCYEVVGSGSFPLDMLRYDRAWFLHETEAGHVERVLRHFAPETYKIQLEGLGAPTVLRWKSFGWRVSDMVGTRTLNP